MVKYNYNTWDLGWALLIITPTDPLSDCVLPVPKSLGLLDSKSWVPALRVKMEGRKRAFCQRTWEGRKNSTEFKAMTAILSFGNSQTDGLISKERSCYTEGATDPDYHQGIRYWLHNGGMKKSSSNSWQSLGLLMMLPCNFSKQPNKGKTTKIQSLGINVQTRKLTPSGATFGQ